MNNKIKELRVSLDGMSKLIAGLMPGREVALARTSCEISKMWLGKTLEARGATNPYPDSKDPSNEKIEPTADTFTSEGDVLYLDYSHIQKVKHIRKRLEEIHGVIFDLWLGNDAAGDVKASVSLECSYKSCIESGMWLGAELGRINNEASQENK